MKTFANPLQNRLIEFSSSAISISQNIPQNYVGKYLSQQLMRSSISPSLNYAEACSAESRADFIHKMKICLKELKETEVCLALIQRNVKSNTNIENVLKETDQLIAIFVSSIKTATNAK